MFRSTHRCFVFAALSMLSCQWHQESGDESGDSGPLPPSDARRVFVTSDTSTANLGGVDGGHARCQAAAEVQGLGGTWKAWLSGEGLSPTTEFVHSEAPYELLDGTTVAESWTALVEGSLLHGITMTETGATIPSAEVWTGVSSSGGSTGDDCSAWTSESAIPPYGTVGLNDSTDERWTDAELQSCDQAGVRLYCFEQ